MFPREEFRVSFLCVSKMGVSVSVSVRNGYKCFLQWYSELGFVLASRIGTSVSCGLKLVCELASKMDTSVSCSASQSWRLYKRQ